MSDITKNGWIDLDKQDKKRKQVSAREQKRGREKGLVCVWDRKRGTAK